MYLLFICLFIPWQGRRHSPHPPPPHLACRHTHILATHMKVFRKWCLSSASHAWFMWLEPVFQWFVNSQMMWHTPTIINNRCLLTPASAFADAIGNRQCILHLKKVQGCGCVTAKKTNIHIFHSLLTQMTLISSNVTPSQSYLGKSERCAH